MIEPIRHILTASMTVPERVSSAFVGVFNNRSNGQQELSTHIDGYALVRPIEKTSLVGQFGVGIYEKDGEKVFIKTWKGKFKDENYYRLMNECSSGQVVRRELIASAYSHSVRIPEIKKIVRSTHSLSVIFEYIEGDHVDQLPTERQTEIYQEILKTLDSISENLQGNKLMQQRGPTYILLSTLIAALLVLIRNPKQLVPVTRALWRSLVSAYALRHTQLRLAHGDLGARNVIFRDGVAYLVDCAAMSLTLPFYDMSCLSLSPNGRVFAKELALAPHHNLVKNYIAFYSLLIFRDSASVREACLQAITEEEDIFVSKKMNLIYADSLTDSLRSEWIDLWKKSPSSHIENSPSWFDAACEAFNYQTKLIIAAYDAQTKKLTAVIPLIKEKRYGLWIYAMPASEFLTSSTLLFGPDATSDMKREFLTAITKFGTGHFQFFTQEEIDTLCTGKNKMLTTILPLYTELLIDTSHGALGELSKRRLKNVLAKSRTSPVPLTVAIEKQNVSPLLQQCFNIDRISAKHRHGKGVFWRSDARHFYNLLAQNSPGQIIVTLVYSGKTPVAYYLDFLSKGGYVGSQKAYLPEYKRYMPGFLGMIELLNSLAINERPVRTSFGVGYDQFKIEFTKNAQILAGLVISKNFLVRLYISNIIRFREYVYRILVANPQLYAAYKKLHDGFLNSRTEVQYLYE